MLYERDFRIANSNLDLLQQTSDEAFLSCSCFYTQQALEKYFKYKLEILGISHVSGHNLRKLCELLDVNNVSYDSRIIPYLREVSEWFVESRYNANFIADTTTLTEVLDILNDMITSDNTLKKSVVKSNLFIK